ncbi:GTPase family protein [Stenotrophomonas maltophilia]|uniref:GTPase family protein n=2 Tax=Lysobacteraceae TaxID=32033 RepID=UPI00063F1527|nr:GTPase [Stenotrophomonas maltophilia]UXB41333.1 50S ribosome-binding GTPase [Stenotrophomonas maltophilia]HEL4247510.1 50S ribosome-binding GTPase [Stenotrophomonas maltophilia]HEL7611378.1 50S ribosome-binding GTPase [Stenotrophomonas maltophilia]HEL7758514.1 50S ribosome-binding GTPase [Stenotrophomonas maltophilia]
MDLKPTNGTGAMIIDDVSSAGKQAEGDLFKAFDELGLNPSDEQVQQLKAAVSGIVNVKLKVGVFGQTGMGKSSLCNALFGAEISKVGHGVSMTRQQTEAQINLGNGGGITLVDFPGLGEDEERDEEYKALYKKEMPKMDLILWMLAVNDRKNKDDILAHEELVRPIAKENAIPVIFVANKADAAQPSGDWNLENNRPSLKQQKSIDAAVLGSTDENGVLTKGFVQKFSVEHSDICVVSVDKGYGLVRLVDTIVRSLPADKKFGVVREAKKETVSEQAKTEAKEGLFDTIKREVMRVVKEAAPALAAAAAKKLIEIGLGWLRKKPSFRI